MGRFASLCMALHGVFTTAIATELIPPSQDPWYRAPQGFETKAPGTILRTRQAPPNITALVNNSAEAHQLLFRSTDTRYRPSWAVTTVFLPTEQSKIGRDKPALLSYQIPYNTLDVDQSPSYGLSTIYGEDIMADVRECLSRGWAVSVPDFEGPDAAFSAGPQAGHAVIDSVRAVLSFTNLTDPNIARYALWGYSGGAFASGFAAELQASYAPELDFSGIALGGVLSNFTQIIYNVTGSPVAAIVPYALLGLTAQYPDARQYLIDQMHKEGLYNATTFLSALRIPAAEAIALFSGQNIFDYFIQGDEIMRAPELARVIGNNWHESYHGIPQMPVYAYKAIHDENTNIRTTDEHVARICGVGANVRYDRNTIGGHQDESISGGKRALKWLSDALDGRELEPKTGCRVQDVTEGV
ncbi:hypothetical protein PgNI_11084 [Pyricularia grisea]|uniref:Uncharacterized protein n=1 Tax=Pyricularia grisea TaxID=148305 RepID=A0A6P8AZ70_PYRGI|nr:hypothetical protein PgNI_11084 [Pyricularia grisea]TLD07683.1 hypothetical protein PgNI_11084 [Pyricularia grisea]